MVTDISNNENFEVLFLSVYIFSTYALNTTGFTHASSLTNSAEQHDQGDRVILLY